MSEERDNPMLVIETIAGNIQDPLWTTRVQRGTVDWIVLDQWAAQKSRLRKRSERGTDVAISLSRGMFLRDGDVLAWDPAAQVAIVARVMLKDVMVIELDAILRQAPEAFARTCVELGHALGNQHWPAVIKGYRVFVPLTVDQRVMASVMKTHAFDGITTTFMSGAEVIPYLAPHESRRLFGGAEGPVHAHPIEQGHSHDQTHSHRHAE